MSRFVKGQVAHNAGLRKEAKLRGDAHYFTGKPCKNGHIDKRFVENGRCLSCAKELIAQRRSLRSAEQIAQDHEKARVRAAEWRKNNPNHENTKLENLS